MNNIDTLRTQLLDTLSDLRRRDNPMEPDRARAIAQVAGVIVDTARVEVDYLRAVSGQHSQFIQPVAETVALASGAKATVTRHKLQG